MEEGDEVYCLHYKGRRITQKIWETISEELPRQRYTKPPKRVYERIQDAKRSRSNLPEQIRSEVKVVTYRFHSEVEEDE